MRYALLLLLVGVVGVRAQVASSSLAQTQEESNKEEQQSSSKKESSKKSSLAMNGIVAGAGADLVVPVPVGPSYNQITPVVPGYGKIDPKIYLFPDTYLGLNYLINHPLIKEDVLGKVIAHLQANPVPYEYIIELIGRDDGPRALNAALGLFLAESTPEEISRLHSLSSSIPDYYRHEIVRHVLRRRSVPLLARAYDTLLPSQRVSLASFHPYIFPVVERVRDIYTVLQDMLRLPSRCHANYAAKYSECYPDPTDSYDRFYGAVAPASSESSSDSSSEELRDRYAPPRHYHRHHGHRLSIPPFPMPPPFALGSKYYGLPPYRRHHRYHDLIGYYSRYRRAEPSSTPAPVPQTTAKAA